MPGLLPGAKSMAWSCKSFQRGVSYVDGQQSGLAMLDVPRLHIYIYIYMYIHIHIYIYTHIHTIYIYIYILYCMITLNLKPCL